MSDKYKEHPIAAIFPMIAGPEFEKLKQDIDTNGIKESGLLYEGKVLDGRNRYRAACELGIEMNWAEVELGEPDEIEAFDPMAYVLSQNLHRRHLKQSQRAMIAAKMANMQGGTRTDLGSKDTMSIEDAAALLSVSEPTVKRAKHVLANGCKQLIDAVTDCEITVSMAEKLCKACDDKQEQARLVKDGKEAVKLFLNPTPHEQPEQPIDCSDSGKYDYRVVKAFQISDYRLNTLHKIIDSLELHEAAVVRDWIVERLH